MKNFSFRTSILTCSVAAFMLAGFAIFKITAEIRNKRSFAVTKIERSAKEADSEESKAECRKHVRVLCLAIDGYRSLRHGFPPGAIFNDSLPAEKRWSWLALLWDYIDGNPPGIPDRSLAWNDKANFSLIYFDKITGNSRTLDTDLCEIFLCPDARARIDSNHYGLASYVGIAGLGNDAAWLPVENPRAGIFGYREGTRTEQVKDGLANTSMIAETSSKNGPWRAAGFPTMRGLDRARQPYLGRECQFGGLHQNGAFVAFADGSVRFVSEKINPQIFEAMSTIAGGESVEVDPNIKQ